MKEKRRLINLYVSEAPGEGTGWFVTFGSPNEERSIEVDEETARELLGIQYGE